MNRVTIPAMGRLVPKYLQERYRRHKRLFFGSWICFVATLPIFCLLIFVMSEQAAARSQRDECVARENKLNAQTEAILSSGQPRDQNIVDNLLAESKAELAKQIAIGLRQHMLSTRINILGAALQILTFSMMFCVWRMSYLENRRRRRIDRSLCPDCGYDLRASPGICPECGSQDRS
jgi:hypothetical protein